MKTFASRFLRPYRRGPRRVLLGVCLMVPLLLSSAARAQVAIGRTATLPSAPASEAWQKIAPAVVPLIPQDMVEPRQLAPTTPQVSVRALTDGTKLALLLEWTDATADDVVKPAEFTADVPAPQMGEPGRPVEVTYWRASWQAVVDGRPDTVRALYPGASVDHYPFEAPPLKDDPAAGQAMAKRYAPAVAAGNEMAERRTRPVEDLVAEGPGTLSPAPRQESTGSGKRTPNGWAVMLVRPLPESLAVGKRSQVAFAVWDGARGEVGARKMRSVWVPIAVEKKP
jgi:hypothetical protein